MPAYISYLGKTMLMFMLAGAQCCMNILELGPCLDREDTASHQPPPDQPVAFPLKYLLSATLLTIATALVVVTRYVSTNLFIKTLIFISHANTYFLQTHYNVYFN